CRSVSIVPTTTSEKSWPRCSAIISQCSAENETAPVGKTGAAYFIHLVAHGGRNQMQYADYQKSYDLATGFSLPRELTWYASINACLFPLVPGTKVPFEGFEWKEHASKDTAVWRQWLQTCPDCNWAMHLGRSGLIAIDIDVKHVGTEKAWAEY